MSFAVLVMLGSFFWLLYDYQKRGRLYIGYTTVLTLLFGGVLLCGIFGPIFFDNWSSQDLLSLLVWILGAVVIYLTSQLTLAFEKIRHLSQESGLEGIKKEHLQPTPPPTNHSEEVPEAPKGEGN